LKQREIQEVSEKITPSLFLARMRVTGESRANENEVSEYLRMISEDIYDYFPDATVDQIKNALKFGSGGGYGEYYKFTGLIACTWIRRYLEENPRKIGPEEQEYLDMMKRVRSFMSCGYSFHEDETGYDRSAVNTFVAISVAKKEWDEIFDESNDDEIGERMIGGEKVRQTWGEYMHPFREKAKKLRQRFFVLHDKYGN
jgi:hypothetical protein